MLARLAELEQQLLAHSEARNLQPEIDLVRQTIAAIKADQDPPPLRNMTDIASEQSR